MDRVKVYRRHTCDVVPAIMTVNGKEIGSKKSACMTLTAILSHISRKLGKVSQCVEG